MKLSVQLEAEENILNEFKIGDAVLDLCRSADVDHVAVAKMLLIYAESEAARCDRINSNIDRRGITDESAD